MHNTYLGATSKEHIAALRHQGMLITDCYAQLRSMLENQLSLEHARFFAEPIPDPGGSSIDWYSDAPGSPVAASELPEELKQAAQAKFERIWSEINAFAQSLEQHADGTKRLRGGVLSLALRFPGPESLYMVGEQPVLIAWGCDAVSGILAPQDIMRAGFAVAAPAAVLAPPPPTGDPQDDEPRRAAPAAFPWWRALLFLLAGLLLVGALFLLAGLLFTPERPFAFDRGFGCAAQPPQQAEKPAEPPATPPSAEKDDDTDPALVAQLKDEQEKERSLRLRIEDLRRELSMLQNACPRAEVPKPKEPEPPKPETPPEEPPSLAELMPSTPESAPEPPKPEAAPKKEQPKKETPKKAPKVARGQELQIPEGAHKNNDLSFLEGCWDYVPGSSTLNPRATDRGQYCFNGKGGGTRTFRQANGDVCSGPTRVAFDASGNLVFNDSRAPCKKDGSYYTKNRKVCVRQPNGQTRCSAVGEGNKRWKISLRRR